jgi:hypothetical protein
VRFDADPFVLSHLANRLSQAEQESFHCDDITFDLHLTGLQTDESEQVVDQLEQAHAVGLHRIEKIAGFGIAHFLAEPFQRRQQQSERGAKFVRDVGEKAVLDLVELDELLMTVFEFRFFFFKLMALGLDLVAELEFAEARLAIKVVAGHREHAGHNHEINVVEKDFRVAERAVQKASNQIHSKGDEQTPCAFYEGPSQDDTCAHQHEI